MLLIGSAGRLGRLGRFIRTHAPRGVEAREEDEETLNRGSRHSRPLGLADSLPSRPSRSVRGHFRGKLVAVPAVVVCPRLLRLNRFLLHQLRDDVVRDLPLRLAESLTQLRAGNPAVVLGTVQELQDLGSRAVPKCRFLRLIAVGRRSPFPLRSASALALPNRRQRSLDLIAQRVRVEHQQLGPLPVLHVEAMRVPVQHGEAQSDLLLEQQAVSVDTVRLASNLTETSSLHL